MDTYLRVANQLASFDFLFNFILVVKKLIFLFLQFEIVKLFLVIGCTSGKMQNDKHVANFVSINRF